MEDWTSVLRSEFRAEEDSFFLHLRSEAEWDRDGFRRLAEAMEASCRATDEQKALERWLALGFWYVPQTVRAWTRGWKTDGAEYRNAACQYLDDLAYWFFFGESPWTDDGEQAKSELQRLAGQSEA